MLTPEGRSTFFLLFLSLRFLALSLLFLSFVLLFVLVPPLGFVSFLFLCFSLILELSAAMAELYKLTHPNHYKSVEGLRVEEHLLSTMERVRSHTKMLKLSGKVVLSHKEHMPPEFEILITVKTVTLMGLEWTLISPVRVDFGPENTKQNNRGYPPGWYEPLMEDMDDAFSGYVHSFYTEEGEVQTNMKFFDQGNGCALTTTCTAIAPAGDVVDIVNTNLAFAALYQDGSVRCWGSPRCGGDGPGQALHSVNTLHATEGAFAAHHHNGGVTTWGHPYFGGESEMVRHELHDIQWVQTNATMFFAMRTDLVVVYWGAHVGILDPSASCKKELDLGPAVMQANHASRQKNNCGRNLRASTVWAEGARNVELKGLPCSSGLSSPDLWAR